MQPKDFLDYHRYSDLFDYNFVPYMKVVSLEFRQANVKNIYYKLSYLQKKFYVHSLMQKVKRNTNVKWPEIILPLSTNVQKIKERKVKDISSLFQYMEDHPADLTFWKNLFSRKLTSEDKESIKNDSNTKNNKKNKKK